MSRIYLDACIIIYLVEKHLICSNRIETFMNALLSAEVCYSTLARLECLVMPFRTKDLQLQKFYEAFFNAQKILVMPSEVFDEAAKLRADFPNLKRPTRFILPPPFIITATNFGQTATGSIKSLRILSKTFSPSKNYA